MFRIRVERESTKPRHPHTFAAAHLSLINLDGRVWDLCNHPLCACLSRVRGLLALRTARK